jgi:hypothetical protein
MQAVESTSLKNVLVAVLAVNSDVLIMKKSARRSFFAPRVAMIVALGV